MTANEAALPAKLTIALEFVYRALAAQGRQIFASAFLQVLTKVVFVFALCAEGTILG
jgi:hypothetical protein